MSFDLLFRRLRDPAARDVVFGQPIGPITDANGRFVVTLPGVSLQLTARLEYDLAVSRSDMIGVMSAWGASDPVAPASTTAAHGSAIPVSTARTFRWRRAAPQAADCRVPWQKLTSIPSSRTTSWGHGEPVSAGFSTPWQPAAMLRNSARAPWQPAIPVSRAAAAPWQVAVVIRRPGDRIRWGAGDPTPISITARATSAEPVAPVTVRLPWNSAEHLPPGRTVVVIPPQPPVWRCYTPPAGGAAHLLFDERRTPGFDILFTCGRGGTSGPLVIPTLRAYIVINSATLTRVSNNLRLPLKDISISGDFESAHWTWSATLPLRALADLEPDVPGEYVELEARLNDMPWRLLVEKRSEAERFDKTSLRVSGRGVSALLSAPGAASAPHNNLLSDQTAQQLAAAALTINGVSNGWTLDWQGVDWLLPAGVWAHTGTPMEAVVRLAEAGGAYVLAAPAAQSLAIMARYPAAPWEWASLAPGVVLPAAATLERGSEEIVRPGYNIVYVCGQGLNTRVRRTGSAGDRPAQMIVDPLTAHADAARQRGLAVLAEANSHRMERLETGILPGYGVIQIGTVLDWVRGQTTRRGIVRELAVAASLPGGTSKDPVRVRQTLGVEIHG